MKQVSRTTIDKIDMNQPLSDWKQALVDYGRRRHLSYTMDFDTRASVFEEPGEHWEEEPRRLHLENRERTKAGLACEFGSDFLEEKIERFRAIGTKPFSVQSYHNQLFDQVRSAFVIGASYPALVGACALGERILNHLLIDLRHFFKGTPEYSRVYRKESFDDWRVPIDTLEAWGVLLPEVVTEFRSLMDLRHRSIHYNASTYGTLQSDALAAVLHVREIIDRQFTAFGDRPWFIKGTRGFIFIKREWEEDPFIKTFYLPTCPFVGPHFAISFTNGLTYCDRHDYGEGSWTDEEFAEAFETRTPDQVVKPD